MGDDQKPRKRVVNHKRPYSAYDRELIAAKQADLVVEFFIGAPICLANGDTEDEIIVVDGKVLTVDTYSIEVDWSQSAGTIWLTKSAVIATRVLK